MKPWKKKIEYDPILKKSDVVQAEVTRTGHIVFYTDEIRINSWSLQSSIFSNFIQIQFSPTYIIQKIKKQVLDFNSFRH